MCSIEPWSLQAKARIILLLLLLLLLLLGTPPANHATPPQTHLPPYPRAAAT
jgi:hypothetical protein